MGFRGIVEPNAFVAQTDARLTHQAVHLSFSWFHAVGAVVAGSIL